ncbi:LysR substrate-binding domain-containing protein [Cedecea neteri]|uniref:LysR substrate-binding domain-containing protein n=1 Tax=Cedecea neteri TaxID=158822 RepID=UPI002AA7720E|nr:LysR substrate-binding domain-containing protein [Cedecea neteri]WPU22120.1 LysR substrate-binding domain-containing protein [Cedecea neteri]
MELRHLRYFVTLAETGHFGQAAARLHIVQPALSMQIRTLEDEVGGPLFTRTSRKVELTEAGRLLLPEARRTLEQAEHGKNIVQRALRGETGLVRIGFAGNAVVSGCLMNDVRAFRRLLPEVEIQLQEMSPLALGEVLRQRTVDVAYTPLMGELAEEIEAVKIAEWPMMVAVAEGSPLAAEKRITLEMLAQIPHIQFAAGEGDEALELVRERWGSEAPAPLYRASSTLGALAMVASGFGIALLPHSFTHMAIPHLVYQPISDRRLTAELLLLSRRDETQGAVKAWVRLALKNNHNETQ